MVQKWNLAERLHVLDPSMMHTRIGQHVVYDQKDSF